MKSSRRTFLGTTAAVGAFSILSSPAALAKKRQVSSAMLDQAATKPVLDRSLFKDPIIIESFDLLRKGKEHFVRVRSKDGAEGISVGDGRMSLFHPILLREIIPTFIGKDARDLEALLWEVYRYNSNYKLQGLPFWVPLALVEFALLDLLGRLAGKSIGELLGGVIRKNMPFYVASGRRDTTPEQEIEYLQKLVAETGAHGIKYRVGGRMSHNADAMPGRTDKLIPLTRKTFGDKFAIHADANSSYDDPAQAIRVGRMLEDINAVFFEEPCPFDNFAATKQVTDALKIPIALGEQESSHWRFRAQIRDRVADIVQPDLFYYGGLIRSIRVARMAELCDMPTTPHLSGGFGFVYSLHFASCVPKIGPWQEYKQGVKTYGDWFNPPLQIRDGALTVPASPGVGIAEPTEILKGSEVIRE